MLRITKARPKDFEIIFELLKKLYVKDKLSKSKTQEIFLNSVKQKNSSQFVVKEENKIVGYAAVQMRNDIQSQGKIGYLSELIIEENYRGKGIGTTFLKEIMKSSKKNGCKEIQFPSTFPRKKAHKFYKSLGFHKTAYFLWKKL